MRLIAALAGLALAIAGQLVVPWPALALPLFVAGAVVFCWSGLPRKAPIAAPAPALPRKTGHSPLGRLTPTLLATGGLAVAAALAAWGFNRFEGTTSTLLLGLYLAGLVALVAGLARLRRAETASAFGAPPRRLGELLAVAAIIALGFLFRVYDLNVLPDGVWFDEADSALEAVRIDDGAPYNPAAYRFRYNPSAYYELIAAGYRAFGRSLYTVRIVTVFLSLLSIPALYVLGRALFGRPAALIAALLLAISRWHVDFSRFGMANISATLFAILAVYFLWRAVRTRRWSDYAWCGLWLGGGLHTYTAFKLFPLLPAFVLGGLLLRLAWRHRSLASHSTEPGRPDPQTSTHEPVPLTPTVDRIPPLSRPADTPLTLPQYGRASDGLGHSARALLGRYAALGLCAIAAFGPLFVFTLQNPSEASARVAGVSVFGGKTTDRERLEAVAVNVQKHLLMFNAAGDRNGRHNLPGAPMLDPITGALFVLGVALALRHLRQLRFLLLLLWLALGLLAGILSLDFEAPQAARALLAVPAAALLAAAALAQLLAAAHRRLADPLSLLERPRDPLSLWERVRVSARRPEGTRPNPLPEGEGIGASVLRPPSSVLLASALAFFLLGGAAYAEADTYFIRQARDFAVWSAYSAQETIVAREMARLGPSYHYYLADFYIGHPTPRFLVPWFKDAEPDLVVVTDAHTLPIASPDGRPVALFLDPEKRAIFEEARRIYPTAEAREIRPPAPVGVSPAAPAGRPAAVYALILNPDEIASVQGLTGRYFANAAWEGEPALVRRDRRVAFEAPPAELPAGPISVEWTGVLRVPTYGDYALFFSGPGALSIDLDGQALARDPSGASPVQLAEGLHNLRLRAADAAGRLNVRLQWQGPRLPFQVIAADALYGAPLAGEGLLGRYYEGASWSGPPALERIDRGLALYFHITPLRRPYSALWTAQLEAPPGEYRLGLTSNNESWLTLDGRLLLEVLNPGVAGEAVVSLPPGPHTLQVWFRDYSDFSGIQLYWVPPGGAHESIPAAYLRPFRPLHGALPPAPAAARAAAGGVLTPSPLTPEHRLGGEGDAPGQLSAPRGLAVDSTGALYVVDSANARVQKFDREGNPVADLSRRGAGEGELLSPADLVIGLGDELFVLDSDNGWITRYAPDGRLLSRLAGPGAGLFHARGLALDIAGSLYVADTGNGRIVRFDPSGRKTGTFGRPRAGPGTLTEPTDLLVTPDGALIAVDPTGGKLIRYGPDGAVREVPFPNSDTVEGPHLAFLPDGTFLASDSAGGLVLRYDTNLRPLGALARRGAPGGLFRHPTGLAATPDGALYVAEGLGNTVWRLSP